MSLTSKASPVEPEPPFLVKLTYFKLRGKYYSEGEYTTQLQYIYEIIAEVRALAIACTLPGLIHGAGAEFHILVDIPDHPHNHPTLVIPERLWNMLDYLSKLRTDRLPTDLDLAMLRGFQLAKDGY